MRTRCLLLFINTAVEPVDKKKKKQMFEKQHICAHNIMNNIIITN